MRVTSETIDWAQKTMNEIRMLPEDEKPYQNVEIQKLISHCQWILSHKGKSNDDHS